MIEERLIDLETKFSHQEIALETLQQLVYEQHKKIEELEGKSARVAKLLNYFDREGQDVGPANEKPPHY